MKEYYYAIRSADSTEIKKLIKLAIEFKGFLISTNILFEIGLSKFKQIINEIRKEGISKPIIADLKLTHSSKEEDIDLILQQLIDANLNGVTVWGLLDKESINIYKKYSQDFKVYAYLGKMIQSYHLIDKILELNNTKCDGIFLSFIYIRDIEEIQEKISNISKPIYLYIDRFENVLISLSN